MARGDDNIGTYLSGYLGEQPGNLTTYEAAIAYLVGKVDVSGGAGPRTKASLTSTLDYLFTPIAPDPYEQYWANYISARFAGTVGSAPDVSTVTSGGGLPLVGVFSTPAVSKYAAFLGKKDAAGPDIESLELFTSHADIPAGAVSVNTGFATPPLPGVILINHLSSQIVVWTIAGIRPDGVQDFEDIQTYVGGIAVAGKIVFREIIGIYTNVNTAGNTRIRQIVPIRAKAALVLALQAVFG